MKDFISTVCGHYMEIKLPIKSDCEHVSHRGKKTRDKLGKALYIHSRRESTSKTFQILFLLDKC